MKCLIFIFMIGAVTGKHKGANYKVHCTADQLQVEIVKHEDVTGIHLEHLKDYPDPACRPKVAGTKAKFILNLNNIYQCVVTKVANTKTGRTVYYHRVIIEYSSAPKEVILVKCDTGISPNSSYDSEVETLSLTKRQAPDFPIDFKEDYDVEITSEVTGTAPPPLLNVGVRQDGTLIDDELNVKPGTPLHMEVSLDRVSAEIYGVMVTSMQVTDTNTQTEPILVNGCSVDPFLFENFVTEDGGDFLRARFRAFKFPESNFVLFKGTVNVCLDQCTAVQCANGQAGHGRRRRDISDVVDPNAVYAISMSTIIKYCEDCGEDIVELDRNEAHRHLPEQHRPQKAIYMEKGVLGNNGVEYSHAEEAAIGALFEEFGSPRYTNFESNNSDKMAINLFLGGILTVLVLLR
jgi:hypothetical protein